jgi:hypothetical protein
MTTLTTEMQTAAEASVIQPVYICRLDIENDPVTVWTGQGLYAPTGSGDTALDGQIFSSVAGIVELSNIVSKDGMADPVTAVMFGVDIDDPLLRQIIRDNRAWRGREAWIWLGFVDLTDAARPVVIYPTRLRYAYISNISINRDQESGIVSVTIDEDIDRALGTIHRYDSQADFFSTDTAADYMHLLANSPKGIHGPGYVSRGNGIDNNHIDSEYGK